VLREGEKVKSTSVGRDEFIALAPGLLEAIQKQLFEEAKQRLDANIRSDLKSWDELASYYGAGEDESEVKGWTRVAWAKPTGAELEKVGERLKTLKLTIRNAPLRQPSTFGACVFTGKPGVEEILIARAY
jgi:prolyl-tRNA synthetase